MKLATWNVNSMKARLPRVISWLQDQAPDVVCFQETKQHNELLDVAAFSQMGYEIAHHGEGRWNGVAIASRVGLEDVRAGFSAEADAQGARLLAATCGGIRVHSVYVPNGRSLESEHYLLKLQWLAALRELLDSRCDAAKPVAVLGDFNIAPQDHDVWDIAEFEGMTHVSEGEREALAHLMEFGLVDAVDCLHKEEQVFTWWDYRAGAFHRNHGMRIDLALVTQVLATGLSSAGSDRDSRKGEKPSDHAAVLIEVAFGD